MIGDNRLTLCEAQMQVIVQEWLDRNMPNSAPLVVGFNYNFNSVTTVFEVKLAQRGISVNEVGGHDERKHRQVV